MQTRIRKAAESRGFAVARIVTHWAEIAGAEIASVCRPVDVSYGRSGFGATLTVLTTGAQAPMLEMQKERLRQNVNAVYGYNAISRIRITQTAPTGFAEGQAQFETRQTPAEAIPDPEVTRAAQDRAAGVENADLRQALEQLGRNVLTKSKH